MITVILVIIIVAVGGIILSRNKSEPEQKPTSDNYEYLNSNLLLNTDKGAYQINERVYFQITSLTDNGESDCEANLELKITGPEDIEETLSTEDDSISLSSTCGPENTSSSPDYTAIYEPEKDGVYNLKLTDLDDDDLTGSSFLVGDVDNNISLTRWGASKIITDKDKRYPMKFTLKVMNNFTGQLVENVPSELEIVWHGPAKIEKNEKMKTLTWDLDLTAGEEKEISYEYTSGGVEDKAMILGKAKLISNGEVVYEENRPWTVIVSKN